MALTNADIDYAIENRTCMCGSRLPRESQYDARGIFLCYACDRCVKEKLSHYRTEVLTNSQYECDEQIDDDY